MILSFMTPPEKLDQRAPCGYVFNPALFGMLVRRGYNESQIAKLWSRNLLRVWSEVEKVANNFRKNSRF